jgi:hypothetical protein
MNSPARLAAALLVASASTHAATLIHRCGNEYTDLPCAQARTFAVADPVTAEQRAQARQVALREQTLAAEMARDRRAQEALRPALAVSLSGPPAAPVPAAAKKRAKSHKRPPSSDDARDFVASVPKAKKAGS